MDGPVALSFEQQLDHFRTRGMDVSERDIEKIKNVGYYRLKEFARPLSKTKKVDGTIIIDYSGVSFSEVLTRYYQDKNLRLHILHAIEKVEVSVKTKLSSILGDNYGAFGYLNFSNWCDKKNYSRYDIENKQFFFKRSLKKTVVRSFSSDIKKKINQDKDGFPTVWLAIDVLTFGEMVNIIEVMSNKNQKKIAAFYNCSALELVSWLKCLNFLRNLCAHNSTIIDLKLKTQPIYKPEWNSKLYAMTDQTNNVRPSNRLAVVFLILHHFVKNINSQYGWRNIQKSVSAICAGKQKNAELLGFTNLQEARNIFAKQEEI